MKLRNESMCKTETQTKKHNGTHPGHGQSRTGIKDRGVRDCLQRRRFFKCRARLKSTMAVMFNLRVALTLLGFLCLTDALLDSSGLAEIRRNVKILQKEKQDIATKYVSTNNFRTKVLDKGIILVDKMSAMVEEYGIEEEFPLVAEFVEDLKEFLKETKDYTSEQINTLVDEFQDKEENIKLLLMKLL